MYLCFPTGIRYTLYRLSVYAQIPYEKGGIRYEIDDKKLLFDAGYSDIMIRNAHSLGVDLKKITHIVLSHGHDDHSVGLSLLF